MKTRYAVILLLLTFPVVYSLSPPGRAEAKANQFVFLPAWRLEEIPANPIVSEDNEILGTVVAPDGVGIAGSYRLKGRDWSKVTPEAKRQAVLDAVNTIVNEYNARVMAAEEGAGAEIRERKVQEKHLAHLPAWRLEEIPGDPIVNEDNEIRGTVMAPDGVGIAGSYILKGRDWSKATPEAKRQAVLDAVNAIVNDYNARAMAAAE
jgi:hypothetical protein